MSPPDYQGVPGKHRLSDSEIRARARAAEVESVVEEAEDRASVVDFGKAVHVQHGRLRIVIPWVVVAAVITALGTYYGAHTAQAATPPNDVVLNKLADLQRSIDANEQDRKLQTALLIQRVSTLETKNGETQALLTAALHSR